MFPQVLLLLGVPLITILVIFVSLICIKNGKYRTVHTISTIWAVIAFVLLIIIVFCRK